MEGNPTTTNDVRVLVVDDEDPVRRGIQRVLLTQGFLVTEARGAVEALELFAPGRFDLVLTDCEMPGMTGAELIQRISAQAPEQRIGLVSAHVDRCLEVMDKVDFHLHKPFQVNELIREVRRVLGLDGA